MKNLNLLILPLWLMLLAGCTGATYSFRVTSSSFGIDEQITNNGNLPGAPEGDSYDMFIHIPDDDDPGYIAVSGGDFTLSRSRITLIGRDLEPDEEPYSMLITFGNWIDATIDHTVLYNIDGGPNSPNIDFEINGTQVDLPGIGIITQLRNSEGQSIAFSGSDPHVISIQMNFFTREAIFTVIQNDFDDSIEFELEETFGIGQGLTIMNFQDDTIAHVRNPVGVYFD